MLCIFLILGAISASSESQEKDVKIETLQNANNAIQATHDATISALRRLAPTMNEELRRSSETASQCFSDRQGNCVGEGQLGEQAGLAEESEVSNRVVALAAAAKEDQQETRFVSKGFTCSKSTDHMGAWISTYTPTVSGTAATFSQVMLTALGKPEAVERVGYERNRSKKGKETLQDFAGKRKQSNKKGKQSNKKGKQSNKKGKQSNKKGEQSNKKGKQRLAAALGESDMKSDVRSLTHSANEYLTEDNKLCRVTTARGELFLRGMAMVVEGKATSASMAISFVKMTVCKQRALGFKYPGVQGSGSRALCADHSVAVPPSSSAGLGESPRKGKKAAKKAARAAHSAEDAVTAALGKATPKREDKLPSCCEVKKIIVRCKVTYTNPANKTMVTEKCEHNPAANVFSVQVV